MSGFPIGKGFDGKGKAKGKCKGQDGKGKGKGKKGEKSKEQRQPDRNGQIQGYSGDTSVPTAENASRTARRRSVEQRHPWTMTRESHWVGAWV